MKNPILVPELRELLRKKRFAVLKEFIDEHHEREIAEYLALLRPDEILKILNLTGLYKRAEIFSYLDMDVQVELVSGESKKNVADLLMQMSPDDRADLFQHLEKNVADKLLLLLPLNERLDVIKLTSYLEETAGAIMTTDYATLLETDRVDLAIKKLRREAPSKETIYYSYVTDGGGRLIGFVSLRNLILARPAQRVESVMKRDIIFARVDDDREKAARLIAEYDLIALPIVDHSERLIGIITHDDAMDIIRDEQTEDMERLMAISGGVEDKPYLDIPAFTHFKKRVVWVVILAVLGLVSGLIIEGFRDSLEQLIILTFYLPLLTSTGGNTGSQSATVVLRAIALNELFPEDIVKVILKEFVVSTMLCVCLGVLAYGRVLLLSSSADIPPQFTLGGIATVVAIALSVQVVWSTVFGAMIPIIATRLKLDPAVISSPTLATIVDMGGITIYFAIAKMVLGI
ncbi:MAG: magnesium transporter [Spirochaetes bacterium]|nr:magnesium transporter [Spirochaetota bacterium]